MTKRTALAGGVVGGLAVVEFTSGVIQGYYTPLFSDIARKLAIHDSDINWLAPCSSCCPPSSYRSSRDLATCTGIGACCSAR